MNHVCTKSCTFRQTSLNEFTCEASQKKHVCGMNCSEKYVNSDGTVICYLTGKCYDQMMQSHPYARVKTNTRVYDQIPSHSSKKRKRERNPFKKSKNIEFKETAIELLQVVLYSTIREHRNTVHLKDAKRQAKRQIKSYLKFCNEAQQAPKKNELIEIIERNKPKTIKIEEMSHETVERYAKQILRMWNRIGETSYGKNHKSVIHFKDVAIGLLYLLRNGCKFPKIDLKADNFLQEMLPPIQDLKHYCIEIKSVTTGKKILKSCLKSL